MATTDPIEILLASDRWATGNIIMACDSLPPEPFHRRFEMGLGSLHDTITHILGAMRRWGDMLAGREQRARLEGEQRTPQQLLQLLEQIADDLRATSRAHPIDEIVTGSRDGKSFTFVRSGVLTHVTTHGMHHRAQCLNMLRHLGVHPLPASSVVEWMLTADSPATTT